MKAFDLKHLLLLSPRPKTLLCNVEHGHMRTTLLCQWGHNVGNLTAKAARTSYAKPPPVTPSQPQRNLPHPTSIPPHRGLTWELMLRANRTCAPDRLPPSIFKHRFQLRMRCSGVPLDRKRDLVGIKVYVLSGRLVSLRRQP